MIRYRMKYGFQTEKAGRGTAASMRFVLILGLVLAVNSMSAQEIVWPLPGRAPDVLVGAEYGLETFDKIYAPMHQGMVYGGLRNTWGAYLLKLIGGKRFGNTGLQAELEGYPVFGKGFYGYASYAYGETPVFPRHRAGLELFKGLPWSLEASLGARLFSFPNSESVLLGTGSISYYWRNFLFSFKPFVSLNTPRTSAAGALTARYYLSDNEEYLTIRVSAGFTPDERWIQTAQGVAGRETTLLKSQSFGVAIQKIILPRTMLIGRIDLTNQEVVFSPGTYVYDVSVGCGLRMLL